MSRRRLAFVASAAASCLWLSPAEAQVATASTSTAAAAAAASDRESALFGAPEDSDRESALYGAPEDSDRESTLFGAPEDSDRESALFGEPEDSDRESALFGALGGSDREADLFGDAESASSTAGGDRESALFGEGPEATSGPDEGSTESRLFDALRKSDDYLDIGGQLWLWLQMTSQDNTPFGESGLSSPNFVDVYLDARPNDRVRGYIRGRMNFDPTIGAGSVGPTGDPVPSTRARLDQLWLKFDILRTVFLTAGKQRVRWGTGRIWNPTDFLNPNRRDSLNFLDTRLGVTLLKVHVPIESLGWNFYAIADFDGASTIEQVGGAFRAEFLVWNAELALSTAVRKDAPIRLGADISLPVWEFDLRIEGAVVHDDKSAFFDEQTDASVIDDLRTITDAETLQAVLGTPVDRSGDWIPQFVVGLDYAVKYNDEDTLLLSLEYFFNDAGTNRTETYLPLLLAGGYQPLYVGRHYVSAAIYLLAPGNWDDSSFALVGLANLSDRSGLLRFNYGVNVLTYLRINAFVTGFIGGRGTEWRFGFRVPPIDPELAATVMIPESLANGFELQPSRLQFGGTLVIDF